MFSLKINTFAASAAIILGLSAPASATDIFNQGSANDLIVGKEPAKSWTGPYIAVGVGYSSHDVWGEYEGEQVTPDFAATGFVATGRIGFDKQYDRFVLGVFGEINYLALEHAGDAIDEVEFEYVGGARAGVLLNSSTLLYVNGGYSYLPLSGSDLELSGPFAGGGLETSIGGGFSLVGEARHTWRSDDFGEICTPFGHLDGIDDNDWTGRVILSKKFN